MAGASGSQGDGNSSAGGDAGDIKTGAISFGNIVSGGAGGFNPFAKQTALSGLTDNPVNMIILGGVILGGVWLFKKK
ncbi:MAG: hypothetical protein QM500_04135 [Methylococcales bacterium]